jgi:hypothetical protein
MACFPESEVMMMMMINFGEGYQISFSRLRTVASQ